jgi:transcription factor SOX7/8/10/18 (SOX group E/F)
MLFRDLANSVIATHCSKIWKNLTLAQKEPWKAAADAAKAEHQRLHPDYKYSPRKPGQKKKRQSRKAKQAAAAVAGTTTLDFASVPAVSMTTTEINSTFANVADMDFGSFDNVSANDVPELMDSIPFLSFGQHGNVLVPQVPDTESLRQDRLQVELAADLGANSFYDMFSDEAFAFRSGADGSATLPSIYSDLY